MYIKRIAQILATLLICTIICGCSMFENSAQSSSLLTISQSDSVSLPSSELDFELNLTEFENFLNDTQIVSLSESEVENIKDIAPAPSDVLFKVVSQFLLAIEQSHNLETSKLTDGSENPYFLITDFEIASKELFGKEYKYSESLALVPSGYKLVKWGYGNNPCETKVDMQSLKEENGIYSVNINATFMTTDGYKNMDTKCIKFSLNHNYLLSPYQILSVSALSK